MLMIEYHNIIFGMCFSVMWGWVFSNTSFWTLSCLWFNSMQSLSGEFRTVWTTESCIHSLERLSISALAPVDSDLILSKLPFLGLCDSPTMSLLPGQRPSFPATFYTSPSSFFLPPLWSPLSLLGVFTFCSSFFLPWLMKRNPSAL